MGVESHHYIMEGLHTAHNKHMAKLKLRHVSNVAGHSSTDQFIGGGANMWEVNSYGDVTHYLTRDKNFQTNITLITGRQTAGRICRLLNEDDDRAAKTSGAVAEQPATGAMDAIAALDKRVASLESVVSRSRLSLHIPLGGASTAP
jgi:hypothetical protein